MKTFYTGLAILFTVVVLGQTPRFNFRGTIKNNTQDSIIVFKKGRSYRLAIPIDKNGNFKATIEQGISMFAMRYGSLENELYLQNDSDLEIKADANDFFQTLVFSGVTSAENNLLARQERDKMEAVKKLGSNTGAEDIKQVSNTLINNWSDRLKNDSLAYFFRNTQKFSIEQITSQRLPIDLGKMLAAYKFTGKAAPEFSYADVNGKKVGLKDFKGKYVYIDVWATWCGPCRQQIPFLKELEEDYKDKKIAFVSLSIDKPSDIEKWKNMVAEDKLGGTQIIADDAWESVFIKEFGIRSIPRFILIDPQGKVVDADAKRPSNPELKAELEKLLK